jgi:hypothetical protein
MVMKEKNIRLHPEQLVVEVLEIMLFHGQYTLPMYQGGKCVMISFKDLIAFLVEKIHGYDMLFHKFNFTLESVLITAFIPHRHHDNTIAL